MIVTIISERFESIHYFPPDLVSLNNTARGLRQNLCVIGGSLSSFLLAPAVALCAATIRQQLIQPSFDNHTRFLRKAKFDRLTYGCQAAGSLRISRTIKLTPPITPASNLIADRAPEDKCTVGFGHTSTATPGTKISVERGLILLADDVGKTETKLRDYVGLVPLFQHEWDAYVSWAYNVGVDAACRSTLVRKLKAEDYAGACAELSKWVYQQGKVLLGLVKRRAEERARCEGK